MFVFSSRPTSFDRPCKRSKNDCRIYWKCCFRLSCSWIGSRKGNDFHSKSDSRVGRIDYVLYESSYLWHDERNPTVKQRFLRKGFGESIPTGFLVYPISQAADITAFKGKFCSCWETTKNQWLSKLVKLFVPLTMLTTQMLWSNQKVFILKMRAAGRLPGLDGNAKMSKSLNNGIYLADDADTLKKKWWVCILIRSYPQEDPGKLKEIWYSITWMFWRPEDANWNCRNERTVSTWWSWWCEDQTISFRNFRSWTGPIRERRLSLQRIWEKFTMF